MEQISKGVVEMARSPLIVLMLLGFLLMSSSQTKVPSSLPPKDAPVVEAFSKQKAMCEGLMDWNMEVGGKDWIDVSIEWVAVDTATVIDNVKHINLETSVDGRKLTATMKYPSSPDPFSINCGDTVINGSSIKYTLYLPPLSKGEHKIVWHGVVEDDLNDGWNEYPKGTEFTFTSTVTVQ
jgi:hypothetical protein